MEWETTNQLAKRLGKSRVLVWIWITRGYSIDGKTVKLAAKRIGRQWAVSPDDYAAFEKACNPGAPMLPESPAAMKRRGKREQAELERRLAHG